MKPQSLHLQASFRWVSQIGAHLVFGVLAVLSLLWYKERLLMDSGYYIYHVINTEGFWVMHDRLVLALSQMLPLAAVKMGLELKTVLIIYSVGHVLYFYGLYAITVFAFKDIYAGLVLLVLQTVGILHSFFTPMFELYYGAGLLVLFYSLLRQRDFSAIRMFLLVALEILALTSHPSAFILFLFVIAFDVANEKNLNLKPNAVFALVFSGVMTYKYFHRSDYEREKSAMVFSRLDLLGEGEHIQNLLSYLASYYGDVLFFLVAVLVWYCVRRQYLKMLIVPLFFSIALIITWSTYDGTVRGRYMEQVYFPIVFLAAIPFLYDCLAKTSARASFILLLATFCIIGKQMKGIIEESEKFRRHTAQIHRLIDHSRQLGGSKFVVNTDNTARSYSWGNWSDPVDALLFSALEGCDKTITIARTMDYWNEKNQPLIHDSNFIFRMDEVYDYKSLNENYFRLKMGGYILLNTASSEPNAAIDLANHIAVHVSGKKEYRGGSEAFLTVRITNASSTPLYSDIQTGFLLSYNLFKNGLLIHSGPATPLEVDVITEYRQDALLIVPEEKGDYELAATLKRGETVVFETIEKIRFSVE